MAGIRTRLRPTLATGLWPVVRPFRRVLDRGRDGRRLRPGITALVAARDEDYTIRLTLRSLVGFADQIICIDNGSVDETPDEMEAFQREFGDQIAVDVVSLPGALVGELWEAGLDRTRHQWFGPWDADMVAHTSGRADVQQLRRELLTDTRPRTMGIPHVNLFGDLRHVLGPDPVNDPGEPKLFRFGKDIRYREYGRYYAVRLPLYYVQRQTKEKLFLHLAGVKSTENLIHRFHYWAWREHVNAQGGDLDPALRDLDEFKHRRNLELFGTSDSRSLKFRYLRQLCSRLVPYDPERWGAYPDVIGEELTRPQRFEVVYRDGKPWTRTDTEDEEMIGYEPTPEDLAWDPEAFLSRFR